MTQGVIRTGDTSNVPCGSCTACCTSSQFIHIAPDEVDPLGVIPRDVLFPAPRLPVGHVLMGYDDNGHCPMLVDGACSIYEHRPRTCRTYDCRAFAASGLELDDPTKSVDGSSSLRTTSTGLNWKPFARRHCFSVILSLDQTQPNKHLQPSRYTISSWRRTQTERDVSRSRPIRNRCGWNSGGGGRANPLRQISSSRGAMHGPT